MERVRTPMVIYQGEDLALEITWDDDDGNPVPLAGYTAHSQVRRTYWADDVILDLSGPVGSGSGSGSGDDGLLGWIEFPEDGKVVLHATADTTSQVVMAEDGVWDIELTDAEGQVTRLMGGSVELSREATKADA